MALTCTGDWAAADDEEDEDDEDDEDEEDDGAGAACLSAHLRNSAIQSAAKERSAPSESWPTLSVMTSSSASVSESLPDDMRELVNQ